MSREIKFRAWDGRKIIQSYAHIGSSGRMYTSHTPNPEPDYIVMQYTGLKDRHGVEIYEGDVIDITRAGGDRGYVPVVFREGIFCLYVKYWVDEYYPLNTYASEHYEVIGNVYENPDLLTNKGESYGTK